MITFQCKHCEAAARYLNDAAETIADWGAYADPYFQEKHDLNGDIDRFKSYAQQIYPAIEEKPMDTNKCPKCGGALACLGGASAHPNNWYCQDENNCGWQAWDKTHPVNIVTCEFTQGVCDDGTAILRDGVQMTVDEIIDELRSLTADANRYRYLRAADIGAIHKGGIFAGKTPENAVINGVDLDDEIDSALYAHK